jgi:Dehydrogenases with different specificities (related to short-chain alcohol dehydrogenases)
MLFCGNNGYANVPECHAYIACLVISEPVSKVGEVAVITGGARGIGVEVVKKLLQCGIHVVIGM